MSEYNWCHNPSCHEIETQSRIRGTGDNKVLRTRKIALNSEWIRNSIYAYFCNQNCLHQFLYKFAREVADLNPTPKPKETPVKVVKERYETQKYRYTDNGYTPYNATATKTTIVLK